MQEERAGLEALEDLCATAPESPRSAPLRAALEGLRRENGRLRAALEEAGLQQEWVLGSVVKSSEADKAQLVAGLRCAPAVLVLPQFSKSLSGRIRTCSSCRRWAAGSEEQSPASPI